MIRRLVAFLALLALFVPVAATASDTLTVRVSSDTAVTIVAASSMTIDYRTLRAQSRASAFGIYVVGPQAVRSGLLFADALTTGDVARPAERVPLGLTAGDQSTVLTSDSLRRTLPAGTYTLYGVAGPATIKVSSSSGLRIAKTTRTPRRRFSMSGHTATLNAGMPPPVWAPDRVSPGNRDHVILVAQQVRDVVGVAGPQRLSTCLETSDVISCADDTRGRVVYSHGQRLDGTQHVELLQCVHYYDAVPSDAAIPVRVEALSTSQVRTLRQFAFTWEPPADV